MKSSPTAFWKGLGAGLLLGGAAGAALSLCRSTAALNQHGVRRIERSIQIARPLEEVYTLLMHPERLAGLLPEIELIHIQNHRQQWQVRLNRRHIRWETEITRVLPYQAIGWKSRSGPLHTGRITLAPVGSDVEVHVVMNYAPSLWRTSLRGFSRAGCRAGLIAESLADHAGRLVEDLLAHLKQVLEGKGFDSAGTGLRPPPIAVIPASPPNSAAWPVHPPGGRTVGPAETNKRPGASI